MTPERRAFIVEAADLLGPQNPQLCAYDLQMAARRGRESGVLSAQQAARLARRAEVPDWLQQGLADHAGVRVPPHRTLPQTMLLQAHSTGLDDAQQVCAGGATIGAFAAEQVTTRPMQMMRGGAATYFTNNFEKLLHDDSHIFTQGTDLIGEMLYPLLCQIQPIALKGLSFLGVVEGSAIYTHWLLDTLPRLLVLMDQGWRLDQFDNLVIADKSKPFHQAVLNQLGVRPEQVVSRRREGRLFSVESFVHVSAPRTRFVAHPRVYQMVNAFIGGPRMRKPQRRILVSRRDARRRKIVNEDALRAVLEPRGFETVRFEDLTIAQTASLVSEASHIVAPHGAGLANLIFANPGTRVLELFSGHISREYWTICAQQGLDYWNLPCDGPDGPLSDAALDRMDYFTRNGLDIVVPVRQTVDFIDTVFLA